MAMETEDLTPPPIGAHVPTDGELLVRAMREVEALRAEHGRLQAIEAAARQLLSPPPPDAHPHSMAWWVRRERALREALDA